ncbi:MAG: hypothetical protein N3E37_00490 [Candidatus Micrarchaeota archaeon]|nr:hypothetical protein [Candidatus Micrarchaeota archaeon]
MDETGRKFVHVIGGMSIILFISLFGHTIFLLIALPLLILGMITIQAEHEKFYLPVFSEIYKNFERKNVLPGKGALWFWISVMFAYSFLKPEIALVCVVCLSVGDGFATLIGKKGVFSNPINNKKTLEGQLAFIFTSGLFLFVINKLGAMELFFVIFASIAEVINVDIDDNLRISLIGLIFSLFYG